MRLIDADALIEVIRKQKVDNDAYCKMCIETMAEIVDEQPTAYDVEKVVEEVKKLSFEWLGDIRTCDVIKIVRKGGVE